MERISDYKLRFELRQQSPLMIKADANEGQHPAHILLLSELVPALNRHLSRNQVRFGAKHYNEERKTLAYDFRIQLIPPDNKIGYFTCEKPGATPQRSVPHFGGYFGYVLGQPLTGSITSPSKDLINYLQEEFPFFILDVLFGGKKSKGFGQFMESSSDENSTRLYVSSLKNEFHLVKKLDKSIFPRPAENGFSKYNPEFLNEYKEVKSGINLSFLQKDDRPGPYRRSRLRFEVFPLSCWEKKAIKLALKTIRDSPSGQSWYDLLKYDPRNEIQRTDKTDPDDITRLEGKAFIRPIMGLSNKFEFLKQNQNNPKDKIYVRAESVDPDNPEGKGEIERYPSQVRFKIFNGIVYGLIPRTTGNDHVSFISNKPFKFTAKNNTSGEEVLFNEIRTPTYSAEDLTFIAGCFINLKWEPYEWRR